MNTKRIVITGGPGTGKTSIINELVRRGYTCYEEISRQVTLKAKEEGIDQLFLSKPLLFSELLLEGRTKQFNDVENETSSIVFLDRGIPDIVAYMDYIGSDYPQQFVNACAQNKYDGVFLLKPWEDIFVSDNERYENFDQALQIHQYLTATYLKYGYTLLDVPFGSIENRTDYIINTIKVL